MFIFAIVALFAMAGCQAAEAGILDELDVSVQVEQGSRDLDMEDSTAVTIDGFTVGIPADEGDIEYKRAVLKVGVDVLSTSGEAPDAIDLSVAGIIGVGDLEINHKLAGLDVELDGDTGLVIGAEIAIEKKLSEKTALALVGSAIRQTSEADVDVNLPSCVNLSGTADVAYNEFGLAAILKAQIIDKLDAYVGVDASIVRGDIEFDGDISVCHHNIAITADNDFEEEDIVGIPLGVEYALTDNDSVAVDCHLISKESVAVTYKRKF